MTHPLFFLNNRISIDWLIAISLLIFNTQTLAAGKVTEIKSTTVKDHRYMKSHVTVYNNGTMVMSTKSWSRKNNGGLKGHSAFFVNIDIHGNAIWVSKAYRMTTIGGKLDLSTPSEHTDTHSETAPAAIGKYTYSIDIYHNAGDISQTRDGQVDAVKKAVREAMSLGKEIKDVIGLLH